MTIRRVCEGCGLPLPAGSRPNRRHHDGACRVRALRARRRAAQARAADALVPGLTPELAAALERAVAEPRLVADLARTDDWRAAAWMLEREFPERWARRDRIEPSPPVDDLAERRRLRDR